MPHADEPTARSYDAAPLSPAAAAPARGSDGGFTRKAAIAVGLGIGAIALALLRAFSHARSAAAHGGVAARQRIRPCTVMSLP